MSFLVLSFPEIGHEEFILIREFRKKHDQLSSVVDPHFTFVFPLNELEKEVFISEIKKQSKGIYPFEFSVHKAIVHKDALSHNHYVFLVPDEGHLNFIKIHDRLYTGLLKNYLLDEIEFIPHITIGNSANESESNRIADEWNSTHSHIRGSISTLIVTEYDNERVTPIEQIKLG